MMKVKGFWLLLSLVLVATIILVACGGGTTAAQPTPTTAPAGNTPTSQPTSTATTPTPVATVTVKIVEMNGKYSFQPATLTIKKGTQVVWNNTSDAPHTVTSDTSAFVGSSDVTAGKTFMMVFTTAGTFTYHCSIHTYMKATIVVQ